LRSFSKVSCKFKWDCKENNTAFWFQSQCYLLKSSWSEHDVANNNSAICQLFKPGNDLVNSRIIIVIKPIEKTKLGKIDDDFF